MCFSKKEQIIFEENSCFGHFPQTLILNKNSQWEHFLNQIWVLSSSLTTYKKIKRRGQAVAGNKVPALT